MSRRGFGTEMSEEEVLGHVNAGDTLHLIYSGRRLAGFASYTSLEMDVPSVCGFETRKVLYLNGVALDIRHQGRRLFALSAEIAISDGEPHAFTMRTQNPAMYSALSRVVANSQANSRMYPSLSDVPDTNTQEIASHIAQMLGEQHLNLSNFTDIGTYGRPLNGSVPRVNPEVERLFSHLGIDRHRGDSMIVVAVLRH
ncbi:MAG: hypothetical protein KGH72_02130 [Candidatus Micrarchaeota archaeon]|nr:hypothetical protein [Candidatus Micrarchaeota archaeon]